MANLEVQIGANISDFNSQIAKVEKELLKLQNQKATDIKLGLDTSAINKQISETTTKLNGLKSSLNSSTTAFANNSKATANGSSTLTQFSRIAQDAPFGIIGIGNNLTATAESFGYLAQSSGGAGNALKAVGASLLGPGGVIFAVSLLTTGLTVMAQKGMSVADVFNKLTGDFDEYADALKKANLAAYNDDGVVKAVSDVNQLREEVKLAKDGFLDKEQVIKHYNETMGKTAGLVSDLDGVEQQLVKNGDAFIKMQLYKATATLAQAEAAKEMLNQEKISQQTTQDHIGVLEYFKGAMTGVASGQGLMATGMFSTIEGIKAQAKAFDDSGKKMNANMTIAKKYNQMAAKISKQSGFNFFEDNKPAKAPKKQKQWSERNVGAMPLPTAAGLVGLDDKEFQLAKDRIGRDGELIKTYGKAGEFVAANLKVGKQAISTETIEMLTALYDFNEKANNIIYNGIGNTFAGLGSAIGDALATGGNVLKAAGGALLSGMGAILVQLGELAIKTGLGILAVKKSLQTLNPYVAIAAGVGLVALGSAFSAKSKSIGGSMGSSASAGGGSQRGSMSTGADIQTPTSSVNSGGGTFNNSGTVVFEISGQKLIGVLSNTLGANKRLGGSLAIG